MQVKRLSNPWETLMPLDRSMEPEQDNSLTPVVDDDDDDVC